MAGAPNLRALPGGRGQDRRPSAPSTHEEALARVEGRVPENELPLEKRVLSELLCNPERTVAKVIDALDVEDFYGPANSLIAEVVYARHRAARPIDLALVAADLSDRGKLEEVGGAVYLAELGGETQATSLQHVLAYVEKIKIAATVRRIASTAWTIAAQSYPGADVGPRVEWIETSVEAMQSAARIRKVASIGTLGDAFEEAAAELDEQDRTVGDIAGAPWGLASLDELTTGSYKGEVTLIGAPQGGGKSTLVGQGAAHIVETPKVQWIQIPGQDPNTDAGWEHRRIPRGALVFAQEMKRKQYATRLACSRARIDYRRFKNKTRTPGERAQLLQSMSEMRALPMLIDDEPGLTVQRMVSRTLAVKQDMAARGIELTVVICDYLQLIQLKGDRGVSREQLINEAARELKQLALRADVCMWIVTALNKEGGARESEGPEYHADSILIIERDEDPKAPSEPHSARIIAKKGRAVGKGICATYFHPRAGVFSDSSRLV